MRRIVSICGAVALVAAVACEDEGPDTETFTAALSGAAEVPAVTTTASGTATFTMIGNELAYRINVTGIDSANAAHIHAGAAGENGDVMVGLFAGPATDLAFTGVLAEDTVAVADSVLTRMRNGTAYVNVHSVGNPPGEIRGQVQRQ